MGASWSLSFLTNVLWFFLFHHISFFFFFNYKNGIFKSVLSTWVTWDDGKSVIILDFCFFFSVTEMQILYVKVHVFSFSSCLYVQSSSAMLSFHFIVFPVYTQWTQLLASLKGYENCSHLPLNILQTTLKRPKHFFFRYDPHITVLPALLYLLTGKTVCHNCILRNLYNGK